MGDESPLDASENSGASQPVDSPSPTVANGDSKRDSNGRFAPGNKFARGNPLARHAQKLRVAMMASVDEDDVIAIMNALVEAAKKGNITAAREVLDRTLGKPMEADILEKIAELERLIPTGGDDE